MSDVILLCCGQRSRKHFEAMLLFALQLDRQGHRVAIDQRFVADTATKPVKYEMAPFLADVADISPTSVIVIGAHAISDDLQMHLATTPLENAVPIWALGYFRDLQEEINARNKIAYATGREPQLHNLSDRSVPALLAKPIAPLMTGISDRPVQAPGAMSRVLIYVPHDMLKPNQSAANQLSMMRHIPDIQLHLLTNAKGKDLIRQSPHAGLSVFSYNELPPTDLLNYFDILVFFGENVPGERMASLALNAMGAGKVVIDCTTSSSFAEGGAPVLNGPKDPAALSLYLRDLICRNRQEIGRRICQSDWLRDYDITALERKLELVAVPPEPTDTTPRTLFVPTNGNGLGHAQRCALLAEATSPDHAHLFAAFPSCVNMLHKRGFPAVPMVARSGDHTDEYAADLVNFLRLHSLFRAGDQLVFDGGYVFDSVYRLISRLNSRAIWIRRGLWQPGQVHPIALERERAFSKVIIPTEAFAELNIDYSSGDHIHKVGPIVQIKKLNAQDATALRAKLGRRFDRQVDTLVVSMLGGGVASERTAQTQLLCSLLEQRSNCLHLIVAWPDAFVAGALHGWKNSHVVQTTRAMDLVQAADLSVSAAGYNSFHEVLYAGVPAILIPQAAPYLDDQERRASAAFERGLVGFVKENNLLSLEREVLAFLDHGKANTVRRALSEVTLPEPGNAVAARIIEEGLIA